MTGRGVTKVAFIGLGAIGREVLRHLSGAHSQVQVLGALVHDAGRRRECATFGSLESLLESAPDLVIECARQHVLADLGPRILTSGTSMLLASVGALAAPSTHDALKRAAQAGGSRMVIPAGALAGVDALAAARHIGLAAVRYTRRAPPSTWTRSGAMSADDARDLRRPRVLFEGSAREAAQRYPKNANVTATIALAGLGFEDTAVRLLADPAAVSNVHVLEAEGAFGRLVAEASATPLAGSTSSAIVAGSIVRAVLSHVERIVV